MCPKVEFSQIWRWNRYVYLGNNSQNMCKNTRYLFFTLINTLSCRKHAKYAFGSSLVLVRCPHESFLKTWFWGKIYNALTFSVFGIRSWYFQTFCSDAETSKNSILARNFENGYPSHVISEDSRMEITGCYLSKWIRNGWVTYFQNCKLRRNF